MSQGQLFLLVYALVIGAGGFAGYRMAKSKPSLIAGSASAALLLVAFALTWWEPTVTVGFWMATGIASLLVIVFAMRLKKTGKMMPSALLAGVSLFAAIWFALRAIG